MVDTSVMASICCWFLPDASKDSYSSALNWGFVIFGTFVTTSRPSFHDPVVLVPHLEFCETYSTSSIWFSAFHFCAINLSDEEIKPYIEVIKGLV